LPAVRTTTARLLCSIAITGALLAACGGDDDDGGGAEDTTTTTVDAAAVTDGLRGQLLALEDIQLDDPLDAPWAVGDVSEGVDIELPACVVEDPRPDALGSVEAKFVRQTAFKLPSLEEDLAGYADAGGAAGAFDAAVARLDGCTPTFVFEGATSTGTIERLPLTLPGQQSGAWRTTVTIAETPISITSIHVQQGDRELSLVHVDAAVPEPEVLEGYAAAAVAALER
jgi:hypothetical protein